MTHHDYTYKEGLNVDTNDFNPEFIYGGGIFFTNAEHILEFLDCGALIADVEIPKGEQIAQEDEGWNAHSIILNNIRKIDVEVMKELMEQGADIHTNDDYALRWAAKKGYLEIVKFLVEQGDSSDDHTLYKAAYNKHLEIAKFLVDQRGNINLSNRVMYQWSNNIKNPEIIQYLKANGILPREEIQCFCQENASFYAKFDGNKLASIEKYNATELSRFELLNNYPEISEKPNAFENRNNGRETDNTEQER